MRVTNSMMVSNMLENLSNNREELNKLNKKLSSGKQFSEPSDDPIGTTTSMEFQTEINNYEQYQKDIDNAKSWLETTENALGDSSEVLQRANELAIYGANDSLNSDDRKNLAREVKELRDELINIANSKLGDEYIFSGQATETQPIKIDNSSTGSGFVKYDGDHNNITRKISDDNNMKINLNADNAFKENIETLDDLYNDLKAGKGGEEISSYTTQIQNGLDNNSSDRAEIGAKMNRLNLVSNRIEDKLLNIKKLNSKNEDIDLAKVVTNLKMSENVYRASLSSAARVIQPSLVDFLK